MIPKFFNKDIIIRYFSCETAFKLIEMSNQSTPVNWGDEEGEVNNEIECETLKSESIELKEPLSPEEIKVLLSRIKGEKNPLFLILGAICGNVPLSNLINFIASCGKVDTQFVNEEISLTFAYRAENKQVLFGTEGIQMIPIGVISSVSKTTEQFYEDLANGIDPMSRIQEKTKKPRKKKVVSLDGPSSPSMEDSSPNKPPQELEKGDEFVAKSIGVSGTINIGGNPYLVMSLLYLVHNAFCGGLAIMQEMLTHATANEGHPHGVSKTKCSKGRFSFQCKDCGRNTEPEEEAINAELALDWHILHCPCNTKCGVDGAPVLVLRLLALFAIGHKFNEELEKFMRKWAKPVMAVWNTSHVYIKNTNAAAGWDTYNTVINSSNKVLSFEHGVYFGGCENQHIIDFFGDNGVSHRVTKLIANPNKKGKGW